MPNVPLGHKYNDEIVNVGVDTVTGEIATTGGPLASGNPVVHPSHPAAQKAMQDNKTGPYSDEVDNTLPSEGTEPPSIENKPEQPIVVVPPTVVPPTDAKPEPVAVIPGPAVTGTPIT
jgi:hypothetical protein